MLQPRTRIALVQAMQFTYKSRAYLSDHLGYTVYGTKHRCIAMEEVSAIHQLDQVMHMLSVGLLLLDHQRACFSTPKLKPSLTAC
jgi:hypothetical protein